MKKYVFNFLFAIATFCIGFVSVNICVRNFPKNNVVKNYGDSDLVIFQKYKEEQKLTFESDLVIACNYDFLTKISNKTIKSFDGERLNLQMMEFESKDLIIRTFKSEIAKADKVLEIKPILDSHENKIGEQAILESRGKGIIVTYYNDNFSLNKIEAPTLKHAKAYIESETKNILQKDTTSDDLLDLK